MSMRSFILTTDKIIIRAPKIRKKVVAASHKIIQFHDIVFVGLAIILHNIPHVQYEYGNILLNNVSPTVNCHGYE